MDELTRAKANSTSNSLPKTDGTPHGPAVGPAQGPVPQSEELSANGNGTPAPASPYTITQLQIRNLTMPPVPNFDIPPSPPGSPPAATNAKFKRFLELKKQGVHFNERLHQSSALRNPGLLQKLMDFAGISEEDSYASALPEELAIPTTYPQWAYGEELVKSHEQIAKKHEQEAKGQRERVDFVPSSGTSSVATAKTGDRNESRKSRFDDRNPR